MLCFIGEFVVGVIMHVGRDAQIASAEITKQIYETNIQAIIRSSNHFINLPMYCNIVHHERLSFARCFGGKLKPERERGGGLDTIQNECSCKSNNKDPCEPQSTINTTYNH